MVIIEESTTEEESSDDSFINVPKEKRLTAVPVSETKEWGKSNQKKATKKYNVKLRDENYNKGVIDVTKFFV